MRYAIFDTTGKRICFVAVNNMTEDGDDAIRKYSKAVDYYRQDLVACAHRDFKVNKEFLTVFSLKGWANLATDMIINGVKVESLRIRPTNNDKFIGVLVKFNDVHAFLSEIPAIWPQHDQLLLDALGDEANTD